MSNVETRPLPPSTPLDPYPPLQSVAPDDPSAVTVERIIVTGKPVESAAPRGGGKLVPVWVPSKGGIVQTPPNFFLWLSAFPDSLLAHLLSESPTAQNLGLGSRNGPTPVSHDTGIGFDGNFSSPVYQQQARNP